MFEPIVFSDLALLGQILRHPHLYLVSLPGIILVALVGVGIIFAAAWLEPPAPQSVWLLVAIGFVTGMAGLMRRRLLETLRPDVLDESRGWGSRVLGLPTALLLQWLGWLEGAAEQPGAVPPAYDQAADIVVIQLESFLDLEARLGEPSPFWSGLQARSALFGRLRVGVRGANTMRTEHAVLSGVANAALGFDRFDPYLRIAPTPGAAPACLRAQGWSTIFIHPNDIDFFRRRIAMPALGFSRLVAEEAFIGAERLGPYVSDAALVEQVLAELDRAAKPALVFAVTMENHGPWKAGRLPGVPGGLPSYRAHLDTMAAALSRLITALESRERPAMLVLYGDHAPALAETDDWLGIDTDYVIMSTTDRTRPYRQERALMPEDLLPAALLMLETGAARDSAAHRVQ